MTAFATQIQLEKKKEVTKTARTESITAPLMGQTSQTPPPRPPGVQPRPGCVRTTLILLHCYRRPVTCFPRNRSTRTACPHPTVRSRSQAWHIPGSRSSSWTILD